MKVAQSRGIKVGLALAGSSGRMVGWGSQSTVNCGCLGFLTE